MFDKDASATVSRCLIQHDGPCEWSDRHEIECQALLAILYTVRLEGLGIAAPRVYSADTSLLEIERELYVSSCIEVRRMTLSLLYTCAAWFLVECLVKLILCLVECGERECLVREDAVAVNLKPARACLCACRLWSGVWIELLLDGL